MSRPRFTSKKTLRIGGFLGAAGLTAALLGVAVAGTGAYFSDTEAGNLSATSGHIDLTVGNTYLELTELMPGVDQDTSVAYKVDVSGRSDVWLTFDQTTPGFRAFSGGKTSADTNGGLGRYGHFAVSSDTGLLFRSYNLAHVSYLEPNSVPCPVNVDGIGGSDTGTAYCGVPAAIKIASGLSSGATGNINLTFGLTGKATTLPNTTWASVPFKIVATQEGRRP